MNQESGVKGSVTCRRKWNNGQPRRRWKSGLQSRDLNNEIVFVI